MHNNAAEEEALRKAMEASASSSNDEMLQAMAASHDAQMEEEEMMKMMMAASMGEAVKVDPMLMEDVKHEEEAATVIQARIRGKSARKEEKAAAETKQKDDVNALIAKHKAEKEAKKKEKKEKKKDKKDKKHKHKHHEPNQTCKSCGHAFYSASGNTTECKDCRKKEQQDDPAKEVDTSEFGDWARVESI
jgi:hypothetical protein